MRLFILLILITYCDDLAFSPAQFSLPDLYPSPAQGQRSRERGVYVNVGINSNSNGTRAPTSSHEPQTSSMMGGSNRGTKPDRLSRPGTKQTFGKTSV